MLIQEGGRKEEEEDKVTPNRFCCSSNLWIVFIIAFCQITMIGLSIFLLASQVKDDDFHDWNIMAGVIGMIAGLSINGLWFLILYQKIRGSKRKPDPELER